MQSSTFGTTLGHFNYRGNLAYFSSYDGEGTSKDKGELISAALSLIFHPMIATNAAMATGELR